MSTRNVLRERPRITAEHSVLEIDEVLSSTLKYPRVPSSTRSGSASLAELQASADSEAAKEPRPGSAPPPVRRPR